MKPDPNQFLHSPLFGHSRPSVTPSEAATALGITRRQVLDLAEAHAFGTFAIGDAPDPQRKHLRLLRFTVEAWFLEKFLAEHGVEYAWPNSPEIQTWRLKLKSTLSIPSTLSTPALTH